MDRHEHVRLEALTDLLHDDSFLLTEGARTCERLLAGCRGACAGRLPVNVPVCVCVCVWCVCVCVMQVFAVATVGPHTSYD